VGLNVPNGNRCNHCGAAGTQSLSLEGLCPACLLASALAEQVLGAPPVSPRILTVLGQGPSTVAYLADTGDDRSTLVVLKRMTPAPGLTDGPARIAALRARSLPFVHRNVARVLDAGVEPDGRLFSITEFWPGVPITRFIERHLGNADAEYLWSQARAAITDAHAAGLVHGGIKPTNLLVARGAGGPLLKVLDFGHEHVLARGLAADPTDPSEDLRALEALRARCLPV
jgi:serine/threonine protein kinase